MKKIVPLLLFFLFVASCSDNQSEQKKKVPPFENRDIPVVEKMKLAMDPNYLDQIGVNKMAQPFLQAYYKSRNYKPRWIDEKKLTQQGLKMKNLMDSAIMIGIPDGRKFKLNVQNYIQEELYITASLSRNVSDLQNGMIDFSDTTAKMKKYVSADQLDKITNFDFSKDLREQFIQFGPKDSTYVALAKGLIYISDTLPIDRNRFEIKPYKVDSAKSFNMMREALVAKGYLKDSIKDSLGIVDRLKRFQYDNALDTDGKVGSNTCRALNESTYDKMERIILVMDKIRAKKPYPKKYLRINIAEYRLRYYENDSLRSDHNIVVGKFENQTPELTSSLRRIIVYPNWNVPYSISTKEILPAVKRNVDYLAKHDYKVYRGNKEVDPYTVNWKQYGVSSFPFRIVQQPGPKNSLGIIKFDFHNEHSVYFHDTPAKSLFSLPVRAFSHGCMRTHRPVELGETILHFDSLSPRKYNKFRPDSLDSIYALPDSLMFENFNREVKLLDPVPIYIEYESVSREGERMVLHIDIYGRDEEFLRIFNQ